MSLAWIILVFVWTSVVSFGVQVSCLDAEESLKQNVLSHIYASHSLVEFEPLMVETMGARFPDNCDYLTFDFPKKVNLAGDIIIRFDAFKKDAFLKRITKVFRVSGHAWVLKAAKTASRGDLVGPHNAERHRIPISQLTPHSVSHLKWGAMQFKRFVDHGERIESWMVERRPDVNKGDAITAVVTRDKITLTLGAKVLQNGSIGDNVKLMLDKSSKILLGTLHDKKTVIISSL